MVVFPVEAKAIGVVQHFYQHVAVAVGLLCAVGPVLLVTKVVVEFIQEVAAA